MQREWTSRLFFGALASSTVAFIIACAGVVEYGEAPCHCDVKVECTCEGGVTCPMSSDATKVCRGEQCWELIGGRYERVCE